MISTNFLPKEPVPPVTSTTCSDQFMPSPSAGLRRESQTARRRQTDCSRAFHLTYGDSSPHGSREVPRVVTRERNQCNQERKKIPMLECAHIESVVTAGVRARREMLELIMDSGPLIPANNRTLHEIPSPYAIDLGRQLEARAYPPVQE